MDFIVHSHIGMSSGTKPFIQRQRWRHCRNTFLIQGLLIARQYFSESNTEESEIRDRITTLWERVEWDWYTQNQNAITWHWSPNYSFDINLKVRGWNEALIVYVLAAASPTHSISKTVYDEGWTRNGGMINTGTFYDIMLPLGENYGGPLFFSHYSFIGLDPRNLEDEYTNYFNKKGTAYQSCVLCSQS